MLILLLCLNLVGIEDRHLLDRLLRGIRPEKISSTIVEDVNDENRSSLSTPLLLLFPIYQTNRQKSHLFIVAPFFSHRDYAVV